MSSPILRGPARAAGRLAAAAFVAVAVSFSAACAHHHKPDPNAPPVEEAGPTTVRVQNQGFLDMNIYVYRGEVRSRLGTVTGNSTAVLTIPKTFVLPGTQLRFVASPIGGQRSPVSEEVTVSPGDEVGLLIPPGGS
ncbi:hypothetical protein tb265_22910 [Gemmatimonadetes bacterium T265]|nr:hypothetical protein tb265_22910 [Gemmatimonadetes bacterium T265]